MVEITFWSEESLWCHVDVSLGQTEGHYSAWEIICAVCSPDLGLIMPSETTKSKQSGRKFSLNLQSCIIITTVSSVLRICFLSATPHLILIFNEVSLTGCRRGRSLQRLFRRTYVHRHTKQQKAITRYSHLNCGTAKPDHQNNKHRTEEGLEPKCVAKRKHKHFTDFKKSGVEWLIFCVVYIAENGIIVFLGLTNI